MYDPPVQLHKTVLMQRLLDAAVRGYHHHTGGVIPLHKAAHLAEKFATRYAIDRNDNQRSYAKRQGRANARLFILAQTQRTDLQWWLLATPGSGAIHDEERLRDVGDPRGRIRIGNDYELTRHTRLRTQGGGTAWTWRMSRDCYERWRERIIAACRQHAAAEILPSLGSLYRVPGFSGIRQQVGKLVTLARHEWCRRHGSLEGLILPSKLSYVERLSDTAVTLSVLLMERP